MGSSTQSAQANPLHVDFIRHIVQLEPLALQWEKLNEMASDHDAPFFQSYAWNYHVARVRLERSPKHFKLLIATIRRGDDLIGIWPLSLQLNSGAWIARSLDDPFGQFAGVVFSHTEDIGPSVAAVVNKLRDGALADGLQIEALLADSALHAALVAAGARIRAANLAVYVDLRPYASTADFRQSVGKKTRKNLRNLRNRLERTHQLSEQIIDERSKLGPMIEETFAARQRWMDDFGRTSPAFRDPNFKTVMTSLTLADGINLIGFRLATEEAVASAQWGFVYLGRYYAYLSAKNPDYNEFSPGRMHLGMVIEACMTRGIKLLELMAPASDYKLDWTDLTKQLDVAVLPLTIKGHVAMWAASMLNSGLVRRLLLALPETLRRALIHQLNRRSQVKH
jgi:CelD/BcsL family acetyltransferase involved in cellulose biosynthesis